MLLTRISASDYDTLGVAKLDCARFCSGAGESIWIYIKEVKAGWEQLLSVEFQSRHFSRDSLRVR